MNPNFFFVSTDSKDNKPTVLQSSKPSDSKLTSNQNVRDNPLNKSEVSEITQPIAICPVIGEESTSQHVMQMCNEEIVSLPTTTCLACKDFMNLRCLRC